MAANEVIQEAKIQTEVEELFVDNFAAIGLDEFDYGCNPNFEFDIELQPGAKPVLHKVRPMNPEQKQSLRTQIKNWEKSGVVTKAQSPWGAALVPVRKKNGKTRWCVDYHDLNALTVKDSFPLPNIRDNLESLAGCWIFSAIDNTGAYHTMKVNEDSQNLTTFVSPLGAYKFTRLPFGLTNAPSAYAPMVEVILNRLDSKE